MQHIKVTVCESSNQAESRGYIYHNGVTALTATEAVVVRNGTISGQSTVDLLFVDRNGNKYVTMITAAMLSSISLIAEAGENDQL